MRVLFIVGAFPLYSETFILNQITGLIDRGHVVNIYATERAQGVCHNDFFRYHLKEKMVCRACMPNGRIKRYLTALCLALKLAKFDVGMFFRAINGLKHYKRFSSTMIFYDFQSVLNLPPYDIIHCHFGYHGNRGILLREAGALKGKLITTFHGVDMSASLIRVGKRLYNYLFDRGDFFLPISEHWQKKMIEFGCDPSKVKVHRMGIDSGRFVYKPRVPDPNGKIRIITVARMVEKKGLEFGIKAVAMLKKKLINVKYTIIGDGPLKKDLIRLVEKLNISDCIHIMEPQEHRKVIELLNQSHVFMLPSVTAANSDKEGIPVVLMEAMAVGLPVVSTWHSGIPELVDDGVNGFLVPEKDENALYEKLKFLSENSNLWMQMGQSGRKKIEKNYEINCLNDKLVNIYQNLL